MLTISGIYQIANARNGKLYIGSAANLRHRRGVHLGLLRRGTHHNPHLQNAWHKYGPDAFEFKVIGTCPKNKLLIIEQYMLDHLRPAYNISPVAGSQLGTRRTEETRRRMSIAQKDWVRSPATYQKIGDTLRGRKQPPRSVAWRHNLSVANKGKIISEETRRKLSLALKGRAQPPFSIEHRQNISISQRGHRRNLGRKHRLESIEKMRQAARASSRSASARGDAARLAWITKRKRYGPSGKRILK